MCSHANMCFSACAQEYFVSVGGLYSLSDTLTRVLSQSAHSAPACKMATVITKTLSACISNNGKTHAHTPHENYWFVLDSPFLLSSCFRAGWHLLYQSWGSFQHCCVCCPAQTLTHKTSSLWFWRLDTSRMPVVSFCGSKMTFALQMIK